MRAERALIVAAGLLVIAIPVSHFVGASLSDVSGTVTLERPLKQAVPTEVAGWRMIQEDELAERAVEMTRVDDYVSRRYEGPRGESVVLYVAFHGNKARGIQTLYHNASVCYPAAGWDMVRERFDSVTLHEIAKQLPVCRYSFRRGPDRISVLTFFKVDDELLDQSPRNKPFWLLADRLTPSLDGSPGTFVQVQIIVPVNAGDDAAAAALQLRFLQAFGASIFQAIP